MERISNLLASNQKALSNYIKKETEKIEKKTFGAPGIKFEKATSKYIQSVRNLKSPFEDACRSIHRIHSAAKQAGNYKDYVTVIESGIVYLIPKENLIGLDWKTLAYMQMSPEVSEYLKNELRKLFSKFSPLARAT